MAKGETFKRWEQEQTVAVRVRFRKDIDTDIIEALEAATKAGESRPLAIKRLIRAGLELDNNAQK